MTVDPDSGRSPKLEERAATGRLPLRAWLAVRRWLDVLGAGLVGAAVTLLLLRWRPDGLATLLQLLLSVWIAFAICLGVVFLKMGWCRWLAFAGLRHPAF